MAHIFPYPDDVPLNVQIKSLGDEELLDFWEETQFLEKVFQEEIIPVPQHSFEYEKLILQELQLRSCRRCLAERRF
ncbi:hypothetical protein Dde_2041 [Oleidesulfovibrio alaskensis G20]|jgi:hypothetical protein|uniref:Uncharacterized protein n=1 Tax=Oleidesulfovibrio alaskensis (strain ATCC BAA-1058 / DSM 17464 / G20) TaxID=207559 RepID=Q30ZQ8_OLEA2|nr:hypothetical protein [Oleidesulfovibrio alaskensis]ABB38838.1 hypothetical protein Dde_2041 [Oleidesulfovibrio alaskensis G20]MBG0773138.1 hypothetical protein [Oleidesulfovibrio alaskensis]MBL3582713.1 hypothetical protein [Oleidesulfovibrio alaskensis]